MKTDVLSKVKRTFQKITFFNSEEDVLSNDLALMNIPALMGRRDAAYDRAIELLEQDIFIHYEDERQIIYETIMELFEVCIENTKAIIIPSKEKDTIGTVLQYLILLNDTIVSASALVKHEMMLSEDVTSISSFIGKKIQSQFRAEDEIFSASEMNILHSGRDLVEIAAPAIKKYRQARKRAFSKGSLDRYNKSFKEFFTVYQKSGIISATIKARRSQFAASKS